MSKNSIQILALILLIAPANPLVAQRTFYTRTLVVSPTGNSAADGSTLLSALDKLWPRPSSTNRWLIKLEPGVFDVGNEPVVMQEYVDIEGSGVASTIIRGTVAPPPTSLLGGVVEGADHCEIRQLTISCESHAYHPSCQGMSLVEASPRLTQLRIRVHGTGSGSHQGTRAYNSHPILENVEVEVGATSSTDNYGIVYGGTSRLDIARSEIVARGASNRNVAIALRDFPEQSRMRDGSVSAIGGTFATGILYLSSESGELLSLDNVTVTATGASEESVGIGTQGSGGGRQNLEVRGGRIEGATHGINLLNGDSEVSIHRSEVAGSEVTVGASNARIGATWLRGSGLVVAQSAACAGVYDDAFGFYSDNCP